MIFLTVGTQDPFDRLVKAVDDWTASAGRGSEVFGQISDRAGYHPASFESTGFLDPASFLVRCRKADVIVAHAGMGTIITSMRLGKQLVMLPRRVHLGEQRNDHQWATAHQFRNRPGVHAVMSEVELPHVLDRVAVPTISAGDVSIPAVADRQLIEAIRSFVLDH